MVGLLASKLNMRAVVVQVEKGELALLHKTRGETRCITLMLERVGITKRPYRKTGSLSLLPKPVAAKILKMKLEKRWPGIEVTILKTHGLTSYYAQHQGILIGF